MPCRVAGAVFAGVSAGIALTQRARLRRAIAAPTPAGSPACSSRPRALLPATVR